MGASRPTPHFGANLSLIFKCKGMFPIALFISYEFIKLYDKSFHKLYGQKGVKCKSNG